MSPKGSRNRKEVQSAISVVSTKGGGHLKSCRSRSSSRTRTNTHNSVSTDGSPERSVFKERCSKIIAIHLAAGSRPKARNQAR